MDITSYKLPKKLLSRARRAARQSKKSLSQFNREAVEEKISEIERQHGIKPGKALTNG